MGDLFVTSHNLIWAGGMLVGAVCLGIVARLAAFAILTRMARGSAGPMDEWIIRYTRRPAGWIFPLTALFFTLPAVPLPAGVVAPVHHFIVLALIAAFAWLMIALLGLAEERIAGKYHLEESDTVDARHVRTQFQVLHRIGVVIVCIAAAAAMITTFPAIWHIGAGIFASAGVVGLAVGLAARPTLSNLLAGVQIALTEPIRMGDSVFIEGEFGKIEEIRTTYVVVRLWDLRRLVMPLSYFIEHPFQNWTRTSPDLIGTVFIYADSHIDVEEARRELHDILESTDLWDRGVWSLQVTNVTPDQKMELRAVMGASNATRAWDLRCLVREKMMAFLNQVPVHA